MRRERRPDPEGSILILGCGKAAMASGRNLPARQLPHDRSAPSVYDSGIWKEVRCSRIYVPKHTTAEGSVDRPCAIHATALRLSLRLGINDRLHTLFALLSATPRAVFA